VWRPTRIGHKENGNKGGKIKEEKNKKIEGYYRHFIILNNHD
jgi:hypothetical protein